MENYYINCGHYTRGCQFVSPCCKKIIRCRICHDDNYLDHKINRHDINKIICNNCSTIQPVSNKCINCNIIFGEYFCEVCRLYICNKEYDIFHCDKCNICRIGNINTVIHCDQCGICYHKDKFQNHKCKENISKIDCMICSEDLFTSRKPYYTLPCEHLVHFECGNEWLKRSIGCPLCRKTMIEGDLLKNYIDSIDKHISEFPFESDEIANAYCNDCNKNFEIKYHIFGLKCIYCGGYNTK